MFALKERPSPKNMSRQLRLDLVQQDGNAELARLQGGQIFLGREPDGDGVAVPNTAVSRNHGLLSRIRNHWFYKDLGSTNGSWVNGTQAREGVWKLIRAGDVIQMADSIISVADAGDGGQQRVTGFPALGGVSLLVYSKGEFLDEYPVPDYGKALIIGGSKADLEIEGALNEAPSLIIERLSANVCAHTVSKSIKVLLNEKEMSGTNNLADRDEIRVAHYYIIFNNPPVPGAKNVALSRPDARVVDDVSDPTASSWKDWGDEGGRPDFAARHAGEGAASQGQSRGIFGSQVGGERGFVEDETISIDAEEAEKISGFDMHPSMRHVFEEPEPSALANLDEKIVFILGIILLVGLVGLMLYWLMS